MTQEDKQLLIKDLCSRLPYGTICEDIYGNSGLLLDLVPELNSVTLKISELGSTWTTDIDKVKPYLRLLSSMTEEEEAELSNILPCGMSFSYTTSGELIIYTDCEGDNDHYFICFVEVQDFLNAHHFDFKGLIPKGLALEAPEGMYNT